MSDVGLSADLELDIARALASVDELEQAITAATTGIAVEFDTSGVSAITDAIADVVANAPVVDPIVVEADTSAAQGAISDLGNTVSDTGAEAGNLSEQLGSVGVAAGIAEGSVTELVDMLKEAEGSAGAVAGAFATLGAATAGFFTEGVQAVSAAQRFDLILGDMAETMKTVKVGDLTADVDELGIKLGSTSAQMENAQSKLFQLATNSGASSEEAADFTQKIIALSARAEALNPQLGSLADISEQLGVKIARGGRFAAQYGIDLNSADIAARALTETHKQSADELTFVEKAMAAASLAAEKYGDDLSGKVEEGSQNAAIQLRSLKATFEEAAERIGQPLVAPVFDLLREGEPIAIEVGKTLGELGRKALPGIEAALSVIGPPLQLVAFILDHIPGPVVAATVAFFGMRAALHALASQLTEDSIILESVNPIIGAIAVGTAVLATVLGSESDAHDDVADAIDHQADSLKDLRGSVRNALDDLGQAALKEGDFAARLDTAGVSIDQLNQALIDGGPAFGQYTQSILDAAEAHGASFETLRRLGGELGDYATKTEDAAQINLFAAVASGRITQSQLDEASARHRLSDGTTNYIGVLDELQPKLEDQTQASKDAAQAISDQRDAVMKLNDEMLNLVDQTVGAFNAALRATDAQIEAKKALDEYNEAQEHGKFTSDDLTDARLQETQAEENLARVRADSTSTASDIAEAENRVADAKSRVSEVTAGQTSTQDELTAAQDKALESVIASATAYADQQKAQMAANQETQTAGERNQAMIDSLTSTLDTLAPDSPLRASVQAYIDQLNSIPVNVETEAAVHTEDAIKKWQDYIEVLKTVGGYQVENIANVRFPAGQAHATGLDAGPVEPGVVYPVGEAGREWFMPSVPGHVLTDQQFQQMGASGPTIAGPLIGTIVTQDAYETGRQVVRRWREFAMEGAP